MRISEFESWPSNTVWTIGMLSASCSPIILYCVNWKSDLTFSAFSDFDPAGTKSGDQVRHEEDAAEILARLAHTTLQIQDGRLGDVARVDRVVRLVDDDEVLACLLGPEHTLVIGFQLTRAVGNHPVPQHVHEREHLRLEYLVPEARQVS